MNRVDQRYSTGRRFRKPRTSGTDSIGNPMTPMTRTWCSPILGLKPPIRSWVAITASRYIGMVGTPR
jgi:hypothetical protein